MKNAFLLIMKDGQNNLYNKIPINKPKFKIGRFNFNNEPDLYLNSQYISKNHLIIYCENEEFYVEDNKSKHGTLLNEKSLESNKKHIIKNGDILKLAKGEAIIVFKTETNDFETLDMIKDNQSILYIDPDRKEVIVDNIKISLTVKLFDLCELLFINKNKIVSHDNIRLVVWKEREKDDKSIPLVSDNEIKRLVDRLRKKLGNYGSLITNIRGVGYMLDL